MDIAIFLIFTGHFDLKTLAAMNNSFPFNWRKNIPLWVYNKIVYGYFTRHRCKMFSIGFSDWCKKQFSL